MNTYINDILLDYSTEIPRTRDFEITDESVQSSEFNDVTRHIKRILPVFSLRCAFTGTDQEEKFKRVLDLVDAKNIITLLQDQLYENLLIQNIAETGRYLNTIEFEITFKQVNLVEFETTSQPLPAKLQSLQDESTEGLQQTTETSIPEPSYP